MSRANPNNNRTGICWDLADTVIVAASGLLATRRALSVPLVESLRET